MPIDHVVTAATGGEEFSEDWDVDELMRLAADVFPIRVTRDQVAELPNPEAVFELLNGDALEQYDAKEEQIGAEQLREIERRVMLSVIDQHWREHLFEMDYLREGINLRAMGQQDPLAEWQREGFDMFEAMMESIKDDFVRYIYRLEVVADDAPAVPPASSPIRHPRTRWGAAAASRVTRFQPVESRLAAHECCYEQGLGCASVGLEAATNRENF